MLRPALLAAALALFPACRPGTLGTNGPEMRCAHRGGARWVAFTPDGQRLVSSGLDGFKVWSVAGALEHRAAQAVAQRAVPERGVFDDAGHFYGVVQGGLWELTLAPPFPSRLVPVAGVSPNARDEVVSARGGVVALLQRDTVRFVDVAAPERPLAHQLPEADTLQGTSAGDVLVVATSRRRAPSTLWAFDLRQPDAPPRPLGSGSLPRALTLSPDGARLALHLDLKLTVFDVREGTLAWSAGSRRNGLEPTGFTDDGAWLFAGDGKFQQSSWNVATGQRRAVEPEAPAPRGAWLRTVSPQRREVVFAREGDRLEVYDLDLKRLGTLGAPGLYGLKNVPNALTVSPDGQWLAVEHASRLHLWNLATREPTYLIDPALKARLPPCSE